MGGFPSKKKQLEKERLEAERQAMIRHRLAIFNNPDSLKPKEEEDTDSEDWNIVEKREKEAELLKSKPKKDPQQMELTENNIKINERKLSAENAAFLAKNLDGPSSILDGKMMKVLEFMLNPEFDKGPLTLRTLLTTSDRKSSLLFSEAVIGIEGVVVLVKSDKGHVFGAYIEDKFAGSEGGWRKGSDNNFLFAMGNITKKPLKLFPNLDRRYSYYSDSTKGFYAGQGAFDLSAFSARYICLNPVVYTILAAGFKEPEEGLGDGVLCGTPGEAHYEPEFMEVFAVTHYEDPDDPATKARIKEREKVAAQKAIEKEKRAKQRRAERKMKKEQKRRAYAKAAPARNEANDNQPYKAFVPTSMPQGRDS